MYVVFENYDVILQEAYTLKYKLKGLWMNHRIVRKTGESGAAITSESPPAFETAKGASRIDVTLTMQKIAGRIRNWNTEKQMNRVHRRIIFVCENLKFERIGS